jgi:PAS domain S-box-containing protein
MPPAKKNLPPAGPFDAGWLFGEALPRLREVLFVLDRDGRIEFAGGATPALLGCAAAELVGQPFASLLADGEAIDIQEAERKGAARLETRTTIRRKNGETFAAGFIGAPAGRGGKGPRRLILAMRDLTEEMEMQEALARRNEQLATLGRISALVAEGGDFAALMERLLAIVMQTLEFRAAFAISFDRRSATGKLAAHRGTPKEILALAGQLPYDPAWLQSCVREHRTPPLVEWPSFPPETKEIAVRRQMEGSEAALLLSKGQVLGVLFYTPVQPLSAQAHALLDAIAGQMALAIEKNQLLQELRESQRKYGSLVEGANDGIMISQGGVFKFVNKKLADMLGFTVSDLVGGPITRTMFPDDAPDLLGHYRQRVTGRVPREIYQARLRMRSGRELPVEFNAVTIEYDGEPASLSFVRDLSERLRLQSEIVIEKETAELYNDVLTHDVSNLLHTILGNLDLLGDAAMARLPAMREQHRQKAIANARRCATLIDRVRDLMMIRHLNPESFTPLPLAPMLHDALDVVREQFRDVNFTARIAAQPNQHILGHQLAGQIFINLMSNAVRHNSKKDKSLKISVADGPDGRTWEIAVEDTGDGIDDALKEKIFQRFGRFSKTSGLGLGMNIVKALVEVMGGTIRVEDRVAGQPGEGARFVVALPKG